MLETEKARKDLGVVSRHSFSTFLPLLKTRPLIQNAKFFNNPQLTPIPHSSERPKVIHSTHLDFYVITVDDTILMYLRYRSNLAFRSKWDGILESGNAVVEMTNCESKAKFFGFHLRRSNELKYTFTTKSASTFVMFVPLIEEVNFFV